METPHKRTHESGMDFEWTNKTGPSDANSPWRNAAHFAQYADGLSKKRGFGDLAKENSFPHLRDPTPSHTHLFTQPSPVRSPAPASAVPARLNAAFQTPRRSAPEVVDSSDADTTPGNAADSEATPDSAAMGFKAKLQGATASMFKFVGASGGNSNDNSREPNQEVEKGPSRSSSRPYYSHKAEDRIIKRRRRDGTRSIVRRKGSRTSDDEYVPSDEEEHVGRSRNRGGRIKGKQGKSSDIPFTPSRKGPGIFSSVLSYIDTHPNLPHILSWYAQLLLNVFLVLFFMYVVYSFWATIRADVDKKSEEAVAELMAEMAVCAKDFRENGCASKTRPPALETVCNNWERCMSRDPRAVGRARVSAHTFAEIFNSFIEPISIKAMIFSIVLALGAFAVSNLAFGLFRNRHNPMSMHQQQHQQQPWYATSPQPPPQTPSRHFSNEYLVSPSHQQHEEWAAAAGWLSPAQQQAQQQQRQIESGSPSKRLLY